MNLKIVEYPIATFVSDTVGFLFILITCLVTLLVSLRWPTASKIFFVALIVRITALLCNYYFFPLPDSDGDAIGYELLAWLWAKEGMGNVLNEFRGPHTYFISWVIAFFYSIFDRSLLMAQSLSLLFGMGSVFLGWLLGKKLWGEDVANRGGWVLALFPSLILYSVLVLRETYIVFFLLIAFHGVFDWSKTYKIKPLIVSFLGFLGTIFFHGAMVVGMIIFCFIVITFTIKKSVNLLVNKGKINLSFIIIILTLGIFILMYFIMNITLPKIGKMNNLLNPNILLEKIDENTRGSNNKLGASYPEWATPRSIDELFYKGPIRITYFMFSPFPWDIKKASHIIGLIEGIMYMILVFLILKNLKLVWSKYTSRNISIILFVYILAFGLIIGNFGTAIRHKSKFAGVIILLAAPRMPEIKFLRKQVNH